tara:strand:- start:435 stop:611 length:177 start_codon:yes stop_codon:yes gene_type:complete
MPGRFSLRRACPICGESFGAGSSPHPTHKKKNIPKINLSHMFLLRKMVKDHCDNYDYL